MSCAASTPSPLPLPWGDPVTYSAATCSVTRHDAACERRDQAIEELQQIAESCRKLAEPIRPPRVLLVEDDRCTASYIAERFEEQLGAEVVTVHDGAEAVALLERDARWSVARRERDRARAAGRASRPASDDVRLLDRPDDRCGRRARSAVAAAEAV